MISLSLTDQSGLQSRSSKAPCDEFRRIVRSMVSLALPKIRESFPRLAERAELVSRWLVHNDLLAVAGLTYVEDAYTELLAWALHPDTHPASALRRQRAWLSSLGLNAASFGEGAAVPRTQVRTDDGIPDLVLEFDRGIVVVESKTGTTEHTAPSGEFQTIAYVAAIRRRYESEGVPVSVILISPDGQKAQNDDAVSTSYAAFAYALATHLETETLANDARMAYAMLFTHLLTRATATRVPLREIVDQIVMWSREPEWDLEQRLAERIDVLITATKLLLPEHE